jgi:hypothetical protein
MSNYLRESYSRLSPSGYACKGNCRTFYAKANKKTEKRMVFERKRDKAYRR